MPSKREKAHRDLYSFHSEALAAALVLILKRVDTDKLAQDMVDHAQAQASAGATPVVRRRAVAGLALGTITAQIHPEDRQLLDSVNGAGWAHATAYGQGEAQATPSTGGPPTRAKVAGGAIAALKFISTRDAESASVGWTDLQLQTIAMGAALAAGDGSALGEATRAVKASLVDTGRATKVYADQLHQVVTNAYVVHTQASTPGAKYDWVTAEDPCPECEDLEMEGPYDSTDLPDCPDHPHCECNLEVESTSALVGV